ncbi:MAG TPA: HD domain-containing protein [Sedimentisphaerales bacterium]|nr:HD domain-containing protein [Sedimentisphaerales bacterium]
MEQEQLEKFKAWFDDYVAQFYCDDKYVNANLKLKQEHTRRTCAEMLYLADELRLDANQGRIAEVIALFHDIGRFKQFVKYRTYNDPRSINHCLLSLDVLRETKVLEVLESTERQLIEEAVKYHGRKELPPGLNGQCLLFSKLIRDADKLDVFYVMINNYRQYRDNPQEFMFEVELPDEPVCSRQVVDDILRGRRIDYAGLKTLNDIWLLQLAWVYDVNFTPTLKRIRQRKFLETICGFLPDTDDIRKVREKIFAFVDSRIESEKD